MTHFAGSVLTTPAEDWSVILGLFSFSEDEFAPVGSGNGRDSGKAQVDVDFCSTSTS